MTPIILRGPAQSGLVFPVGVDMTHTPYITVLLGAPSPLPLALYWDSLLTRIADTHPDRKVVILLRSDPRIEELPAVAGGGFTFRVRLATLPAMPSGFWEKYGTLGGGNV